MAGAGGTNVSWRLLDPFGQVAFDSRSIANFGPIQMAYSGTYSLLVEGRVHNISTPASYSFNVQPVTDVEIALPAMGSIIDGTITHAGQRMIYTFDVASARTLYFDSLTNNASFRWSIEGPNGQVVGPRSFNDTDSVEILGIGADLQPFDSGRGNGVYIGDDEKMWR